MFSISNLKVGARLGLGFAMVLALLVVVSVIAIARMSAIKHDLDVIVQDRMVKTEQVGEIRIAINQIAIASRNVVLLPEMKDKQSEVERIKKARENFTADLDKLTASIKSEKGKALLAKVTESQRALRPETDKVIELGLANKTEEATSHLLKNARPIQRKLLEAIAELQAFQKELAQKSAEDAANVYEAAKALVMIVGLLAVMVGALAAWLITRSITRPLNEAVGVAQKVAAGDLTSTVEVKTRDETGILLQALKDMNDSLKKIVGEVRGSTDSISTASKQIASGNADLSSRTEEQASSLEETASSMEELTSTVKQNTENAKQANQLAAGASDVAIKGGNVVSQVVQTMSSINDSSKKIADIIGVIDGIAFQTNILALNAAVEAARAGEQGRGFAVVATEVRTLAQRSAAAAKEIKELISDSVGKVEDGTKLVDEAGKTMDEIVQAVKRVTDVMAEIAAASQEQSSGIEQVNTAVTQMDEVTQQNAALVEEASAAAESMAEQAQTLADAVAVFKLAQHEERKVAAKVEKPVATVTRLPAKKPAAKPAAKPVAEKPAARKVANAKQGDGEWEEF